MSCAMISTVGGNYGFDPAWPDERKRLALLEHCYDPATTALLTRLGIGPGWRCLDVGAGGGSIARWLRDQVHPGGRVVAVDLDTRFFEGEPGIEAVRVDLLADDLAELGVFDLVHCRALLHHLPGKQLVALEKMAMAVRPGGLLVAEEPYFGPMFSSSTPAWVNTWRTYCAAMSNTDYEWAVGLAGALHTTRLKAVDSCGWADIVQGGSPQAELLRLSLEAVRDRVPSGSDLDAGISLLLDEAAFEPGMVWYAAWGLRSDGNRC